jgi:hypothetical protein
LSLDDRSDTFRSTSGERATDRFSFFFGFYGLILGLAVTELLGGVTAMVRHHALRKLEAQTALLAVLTFIAICGTWIDAWNMLQAVTLDFTDLWAPVLLAMAYYLAAGVIFPREREQFAHLHMYFAARKPFAVTMLWAAFLLESFTLRHAFEERFRNDPSTFWGWLVPFFIIVNGCYLALLFVRGRRATIALLIAQIVLAFPTGTKERSRG